MSMTDTLLTATTARQYAARISTECSDCFKTVKARKVFGKWNVEIDGGSGACYGKSVKTVEGAEDIIRIFANSTDR